MKNNKDVRITFRLSPEQYAQIAAKAESAEMSIGAYVRAAVLKHKIVVVEGLSALVPELKGIGRNINQLTMLANMGKLTVVRLGETKEALYGIYARIGELMQTERR